MKLSLIATSLTLASLGMAAATGCTTQTSRGPVRWTATNPASPVGQNNAQVWSRSTSNDKAKPVTEPMPPSEGAAEAQGPSAAPAPPVGPVVDQVELPPGASLTASARISEIRSFPEEVSRTPSGQEVREATPTPAAAGTDRVYQTGLSYGEAVEFFEASLSRDRCESYRRTTTGTSTIWSLRCPRGVRAHVAIRNTRPTSVEVLATDANSATD